MKEQVYDRIKTYTLVRSFTLWKESQDCPSLAGRVRDAYALLGQPDANTLQGLLRLCDGEWAAYAGGILQLVNPVQPTLIDS